MRRVPFVYRGPSPGAGCARTESENAMPYSRPATIVVFVATVIGRLYKLLPSYFFLLPSARGWETRLSAPTPDAALPAATDSESPARSPARTSRRSFRAAAPCVD